MDENVIQQVAMDFARKNKSKIAKELTDKGIYQPSESPVSIFMAGSSGAGKTEYSKFLVAEILPKITQQQVVRIDGDELRSKFQEYSGSNSYLFQPAISILIDRIHDTVLKQKQHFVLDGTLSKYDKALKNIERSLKDGRFIDIFYLYQNPLVAWDFTKAREKVEGRNIPKEAFIEEFLGARTTVERLHTELSGRVGLFLVEKDFKKNEVGKATWVKSNQNIDDFVKNRYTEEELRKLL